MSLLLFLTLVMGVSFNSVYHITDSPSFITYDKYVILDPHEWCYSGGMKFNFVQKNLAEEYPDQFTPFRISCREPRDNPFKKPFKGTIFRYPLRNYTESEICTKIYESKEILKMFHTFYEKESINCLLFLKYIEKDANIFMLKDFNNNENLEKINIIYLYFI